MSAATAAAAAKASARSFRIALCQLMVSGDKAQNLKDAAAAIRSASGKGAHLVALPECFQSPYATDQFEAYAETIPSVSSDIEPESQPSMAMLRDEAVRNGVYIIGGSIPERGAGGEIFNTCVVFGPDGAILARQRKMHLFDIDIPGKITFRESDTLTAGNSFSYFEFVKPQPKPAHAGEEGGADANADAAGEGDETAAAVAADAAAVKCRIGIGICYDMRFAELAQIQRAAGCEMLVYPGAFNTTTGPLHWELLQRGRAVDNQLFFAACSPARSLSKEGYQAWGHSTVVDPWGKVLATCEHEPAVVVADVDLNQVTEMRAGIPTSGQKRHDLYATSHPL